MVNQKYELFTLALEFIFLIFGNLILRSKYFNYFTYTNKKVVPFKLN